MAKPKHIKHREQAKKFAFLLFDKMSDADELISEALVAKSMKADPQDVTEWRRDWDFERMQRRGKRT